MPAVTEAFAQAEGRAVLLSVMLPMMAVALWELVGWM